MPRKGPATTREVGIDPLYNNKLVEQLVNKILRKGKKALAQRIIYNCFDIIKEKTSEDPLSVFTKAVDTVKPLLEVKPRRVGGATYQVPVEVDNIRGTTLALRWIVGFARQRKAKSMSEKLAAEILEAASGTGASVKKREDLHKMAEANRAFAHYRW